MTEMFREGTVARSKPERNVGRRIAATRAHQGISQAAVARRAGIDPSYLSRIETGRVHPTVRTALRISGALDTSLEELLGPSPPERKGKPCPVSRSGRCLMDLLDDGSDARRTANPEVYSRRQIRLLRRFLALLQNSDPNVLSAFEVLFGEILED